MKQRSQLITLGVLLLVLAGVAFVGVSGNKRGPAPAANAGAGAGAPAGASADVSNAAPANVVSDALPTEKELMALNEWLVPKASGTAAAVATVGFGLPISARTEAGLSTDARSPNFLELQGVLTTGGERSALIGGEAYRAGQMLPNSGLRVKSVGTESVTLESDAQSFVGAVRDQSSG